MSIRWRADKSGQIHLHWRESGGPPVMAPRRRGFGHVVIEQIVPRALKGTGKLEFPPAGVQWRFAFHADSQS